jgi:hypothetical protein
VLEGVGQGLLGDPVGGQIDRGRQGRGVPSMRSSTGRPAADTWATRVSSSARVAAR